MKRLIFILTVLAAWPAYAQVLPPAPGPVLNEHLDEHNALVVYEWEMASARDDIDIQGEWCRVNQPHNFEACWADVQKIFMRKSHEITARFCKSVGPLAHTTYGSNCNHL